MVGGLFSSDTHQFDGYEVYTRDSAGRVHLSVVYFNTARLPAGTVLDVSADGVKVGTLVTTVTAAGTPIASGAFILAL